MAHSRDVTERLLFSCRWGADKQIQQHCICAPSAHSLCVHIPLCIGSLSSLQLLFLVGLTLRRAVTHLGLSRYLEYILSSKVKIRK
ncbi:hypothetical protein T11_10605 [Trichinella zimbabwensis]|uniref:Uncharacterized protein n=1 Tax=Trichinella zimbabwensis TaxID=268475 RepID=A0A0V1GP91_9BILA|nr:hypothetical protein T11_10605 [Trichinella zimbabwensis]